MKRLAAVTASLLIVGVVFAIHGRSVAPSLAASAHRSAAMIGPEPEGGRGFYFRLTVTGKTAGGATLTHWLGAGGPIGLVVAHYAGMKQLCPPSGCVQTGVIGPIVGYVPLGSTKAGLSTKHWNFRVNGKVLKPGEYYVFSELFTPAGTPSGLFCFDIAALTLLPTGRDLAAVYKLGAGHSTHY
jgi:hypothetical protein